MCSFYYRTAQIWKLCSKNRQTAAIWKFCSKDRQTAATPIVLFAVMMGQIQSLFFYIIWGLFRAPLLQPVSKEMEWVKDESSSPKADFYHESYCLWCFLGNPSSCCQLIIKTRFFFSLKKKLLSLAITEKSHENMTEVFLQGSKKEAREKSQVVISLTTLF